MKTTPKKLEHAYTSKDACYSGPSDIDIINKINELIDYLTPEAPTDTEEQEENKEEPKDWIYNFVKELNHAECTNISWFNIRQLLKSHMPEMTEYEKRFYKVVEKLGGDIAILGAVGSYKDTLDDDEVIECIDNWLEDKPILHNIYPPTPTPQATSVIDVEELVEKIAPLVRECFERKKLVSEVLPSIKAILSSLPIQKKRSKQTILDWFDKRDGKFHTQNQHIKELDKILSD